MLKLRHWLTAALAAAVLPAAADIPEISKLVPEARDFEAIYRLNPAKYGNDGYTLDRSEAISGDLKRLAYFLRLTEKDGQEKWVYVSMDPFSTKLEEVGVPVQGLRTFQTYVNNMTVASNVANVATGNFPQGNIEFWPLNYGGNNAKKIPGATDAFDFGDAPAPNGGYTSMQVCNFQQKQMVFAFNNVNQNGNADLGIGNNTAKAPKNGNGKTPNLDWTFAGNAGDYANAELIVAGKFDNFKLDPAKMVELNLEKVFLVGKTDKTGFYKVGEEISFTLDIDWGGQPKPTKPYFIEWQRFGDDGKTDKGRHDIANGPLVIKTSLDRPGFIRILAHAKDAKGRFLTKKKAQGDGKRVFFDGGAGVEPEKLQGVPEPADFDAFWAAQKAKLNAVEFVGKVKMTPIELKDKSVKLWAVEVPCAGPTPVTGYLSMPADAKPGSLPAICSYHGYNGNPKHFQRAPGWGHKSAIYFNVNAHGYKLGQPQEYYDEFYRNINVDGTSYGFSKRLNANRDTAYFNGMTLRVMRSLQFVMSLPEWNGKDLTAEGGSQGGLQTAWAAGLEPKVTVAKPSIPWCCDMRGKESFGRIHGGWRIVGTPALDYFDPINVIKRASKNCHVIITRAGLGDYCCPPSGVAILYNNIPGPRTIHWVQGSTHGFVPPYPHQKFTLEELKR